MTQEPEPTETRYDARNSETLRVQRIYDRMAPKFDKRLALFERLLWPGGRSWACSHARGDTLEIAIGTGLNLPYYAEDVRLTGIELSPRMLEIAELRAAELGREVDLRIGDAQDLDFPDSSFDTVVSTLSLCSIPDDGAAVREAKRVLRPGGRFVALEHVRSPVFLVRAIQRVLDPIERRLEADNLLREPLDQLVATGFEIESLQRSRWGVMERVVARKPTA